MPGPAPFVAALFAGLLLAALAGDLRRRIIPNRLNLLIATAGAGLWLTGGEPSLFGALMQVGVALMLFCFCAALFELGQMGGGDVKMIAATSLAFAPLENVKLLAIMSVAGGVLTVVMVVLSLARSQGARPAVPYGAAIAFAGLWLLGERYLYLFHPLLGAI